MSSSSNNLSLDEYKERVRQSLESMEDSLTVLCSDVIRARLAECGWKEEVKLECKKVINRHKVENITPEEVAAEVTTFARARVPPQIKEEIVKILKERITKQQ